MIKLKKALYLAMHPQTFYRKLIHKLPTFINMRLLSFPNDIQLAQQFAGIEQKTNGNPIIVFPLPSCPWGYLFQRPQQLARALAQEGYVVIYHVDTSFPYGPDWHVRGIMEIEDRVFLFNDNQQGSKLHDFLSKHKFIVWQYWPHQRSFIDKLTDQIDSIRIYDCIDNLDTFDSYIGIQDDLQVSLMEADVVLATAAKIYDEVKVIRDDCILVPNGVCYEDFTMNTTPSVLLDEIKRNSKLIVGYYGAIAEWFDFELVDYIAKKNPEWTFLIVGEVYSGVTNQVKKLKVNNNIKILPRISYDQIPQLLSYFDMAMIPFLINQITLSTSPVKVYEYSAGGKVTVSTALPEIVGLSSVLIAHNQEQFHMRLIEAASLKDSEDMIMKAKDIAIGNSWKNRIQTVLAHINVKAVVADE